jgi:DNA-binding NarL/FixJ family response regulator
MRRDWQAKGLKEEHERVIQLVSRGWTDQQIGRALCVSPSTVWRRVKEAMSLLGARSRAQLVLRAIEAGILHVPSGESPEEDDPPWPGRSPEMSVAV